MNHQRALLDQLMGANRDLGKDERPKEVDWRESRFCKFYLCGFCPYLLFTNTKSDLGRCNLEHDDAAREKFEKESRRVRRPYEREMLGYLSSVAGDVDRKIQRGQNRIDTVASAPPDRIVHKQSKIAAIKKEIEAMLQEMETLGESGKVAESEKLVLQVEIRQKQIEKLEQSIESLTPKEIKDTREDHRLQVCDICGGFVVINDENEERVTSHAEGKQHLGFQRIRDKIQELRTKLDKDTHSRKSRSTSSSRHRRSRSRDHRTRDGSKETDRRDRRRDRDRDRDRDHRDHRDRDRDRHHRDRDHRHRDRDRDRHHRDRHHDRHHDERHRSRDRSRSGDRGEHDRRRDDDGEGDRK